MPAVTASAKFPILWRPTASAAIRGKTAGALMSAALLAGGALPTASAQVPLPPPPAYEPPQLTPSLLDFLTGQPIANQMKLATTPELLKPEFVEAPPGSPKALAAKVKALELDVPNRVAAANYLGSLDCVQFPEAKQQLLQMALEDPFEEVRYAAVMNLQAMLARGLDNPDRAGGFRINDAGGCQCDRCKKTTREREKAVNKILHEAKLFKHKAELAALKPETVPDVFCKTIPGLIHLPINKAKERCAEVTAKLKKKPPPEAVRADFCLGCCDEATLNGLASIAFDEGEASPCAVEPSERVREAAAQAMLLCGCYKRPGFAYPCPNDVLPAPAPIPLGEGDPLPPGEGDGFGEGDGLDDGVLELEIVPRTDAPAVPDGDVDINLNLDLDAAPGAAPVPSGGGFELEDLEIQVLPDADAGLRELSPGRPDRGNRPARPLNGPSTSPTLPAPLPAPLPDALDETASVPTMPVRLGDARDASAAVPLFPDAQLAGAPLFNAGGDGEPLPDPAASSPAPEPLFQAVPATDSAADDVDLATTPPALKPVAVSAYEPELMLTIGHAPQSTVSLASWERPTSGNAAPHDEATVAQSDAAPLRGLRGLCVVELARRSVVPADPQFYAVHEGRIYHFCSAGNRDAFLADPAAYAPAFGGIDPVKYVERGEVAEGTVLRRYEERFYLFERPEHWTQFCAHPDRYRAD